MAFDTSERPVSFTDLNGKTQSATVVQIVPEPGGQGVTYHLINPQQVFYCSPIRARLCQQILKEARQSPR